MNINNISNFILNIIFYIMTHSILPVKTISSTIDKKIYDINNIIKDIKSDIEIYQKNNNFQDSTSPLEDEDDDFNDFIFNKLNLLQSINKPDMVLASRAWYCHEIPCAYPTDCLIHQPTGRQLDCRGCNYTRPNWGWCF
ncbi:required for macrophage lysis [Histoplasma capsulatum G186AR]|uniref:Required for macrophage lysis n=1 Tax=Ajellomyces capsulatus TaxID=5037 RepID=A0A8H8D4A5_AJECA|nr:required for macrophage lysis [Histoplasma capsulatum]QSS68709.1 required for macrophage lysis [Histoplasma capsulatum G186AR]